MFELKFIKDNFYLLIAKHSNFDKYDLDIDNYAYNIYSFRDILKLNVQIIEDKILSYNAKYGQDKKFDIYYYFEDKYQGQQLVDEFNIILKLVGD